MQLLLECGDGVLVAALQGEQIIICGLFRFILGGRQVILGFLQSCVCVKAFLSGLVEILLRGFHGGVLCGLLGGFLFRRRGLAATLLLYRLLGGLLFCLVGFPLGYDGFAPCSLAGGFHLSFGGVVFFFKTVRFRHRFIVFCFEPINFRLAGAAFFGLIVPYGGSNSGFILLFRLLGKLGFFLRQFRWRHLCLLNGYD